MKSEIDILRQLDQQGYNKNMIYRGGRLYVDNVEGDGYTPDQCVIETEHRTEGISNPSDMSIVYGIKTDDGKRGTIVVAYGANADTEKASFFKKVPDKSHQQ